MVSGLVQRRLAAILAADVVGYSALMEADEVGTLTALKQHRIDIFDPMVAQHNGRIFKLMGDGTLVEFASVVDAVKCAMAIQTAIAGLEIPLIKLRIGVNLGDVIIDDADVYGDGVNVAARLEPLADTGGICVSAIVRESLGGRLEVTFQDGGDVAVKNIAHPLRVWRWSPGPGPGEAPPAHQPKPAAASIAVLPFDNMSGDPEQEYFSDGITEDIITDLSKVASLLVIARNSSFAYKGKTPDIRDVARQLGVATVLEGSIRRAGNRVRITAQLIDGSNGAHLWADRYDRELTDIFAVQDDVARNIVDALKLTLTPSEQAYLTANPTANVAAHDLFLRARGRLRGQRLDRNVFEQAVAEFEQSVLLDPDYALAYAGLGHAYTLDFQNNWRGADDALDLARKFATKALEQGPAEPDAHYLAALVAIWDRDLERSKRECQAALAFNPNFAEAYGILGFLEIYGGNAMASIPILERAMRLDPAYAQQFMHFVGTAYLVDGQYGRAADTFRERIRLMPDTDLTRAFLVSALGHLGEFAQARRVWAELLAINPAYSLSEHLARLPFQNQADADRIAEGVGKVGISL